MLKLVSSHKEYLNAVMVIWLIAISGLSYFTEQTEFLRIAAFYLLAFICYTFVLLLDQDVRSLRMIIFAACVGRLIAAFAFPSLSDDIFRFIWDGRLSLRGLGVYDQVPSFYIDRGQQIEGLTLELFNNLNSQEYYSIYPTFCQWIFSLCTAIFPDSIIGFSALLKSILALFDIGSIILIYKLLPKFNLAKERSILYALNPLVVIEISGNGHFEGVMVFFLLASIYLFVQDKLFWSGLAFATAVASKMLPLMFLPLILAIVPWRKALKYYCFVGIGLLLFMWPYLNTTFYENIGDSLNLYFQKFEFNASIYYIVRWVGFQVKGYNIIETAGPILAAIVFVLIWILTALNQKSRIDDYPRLCMWSLIIYFCLSALVHPWYIIPIVALSIFTKYKFPIVWSFLIVLTYFNYTADPFQEKIWIVLIEYVLVFGLMIFEIKKINFTKPTEVTKYTREG